ncbi:DUF3310 domain-containing protein [Mammaliicoccus lentus]|uniref:DUF3310 domain-containing protein n=1 Tax=Mammaliicoccus lentus TaxID=42858 RepID=UPI001072DA1F|nr:DUF3310 domain-containing protein [Mammaliicoccus lentus]MBF0793781.1 DUF3310 domain-containing protein [Mammaliicoccus lentus]TFV17082.1 DUF3310 domain-containing protein [Mammaliicoccus lentus]
MKFKEGDRVHVLRLNTNEVDFYATLKDYNDGHPFILSDCSDGRFECCSVFKPNTGEVGLNRWDYYVLAEDEEDTEEPVVQHTTDPVNHPDHYNYGEIEIIDFIEQVSEHYNPVVAVHIANAIKYLSRAPHKNGKEDIEKARWYIERAYQKWSD